MTHIYALVAAGAVVTLDEIISKKKAPEPKTFIAIGFLAVVVSGLAINYPEIANPLALVVLAATLLTRGPHVLKAIGR